ncbi:MAG: hypothetical protein K9M75_11005 [Phycisphaerae bacterium]|nr:hypothetical protein [Phycisphaerae bacterium]
MKKMLKCLALVSLLLAFAAVSFAAEEKTENKKKRPAATEKGGQRDAAGLLKRYPEADKDKDGKLSKEEMDSFRKAMMEERTKKMLKEHPEIDKDKDGKISQDEMTAFRKANPRKDTPKKDGETANAKKAPADQKKHDMWAVPSEERAKEILKRHPEADINKDGKLDAKEMEALKKEFLNKPMPEERAKKMLAEHPEMDANKDGKLTMSEASEWYQAQKSKTDDKKTDAKKAPAAKDKKDKGPSEEQLAKMLKKTPAADANKDGKLTAEEAMAFRKTENATRMAKKYPEADTDKDGKLSDDEMKELRKKLQTEDKAKNAKKPKANKGQGEDRKKK